METRKVPLDRCTMCIVKSKQKCSGLPPDCSAGGGGAAPPPNNFREMERER